MTESKLNEKPATKVLIVEDEGEMCLVLNILLNEEKMHLDHVKSLSDAGEYLQKQQPSLMILDNKLPDGYGVDMIRYVRKYYPGIRIIMISGFDNSAEDVALENGADAYLVKPFTKQQLFQSIGDVLN